MFLYPIPNSFTPSQKSNSYQCNNHFDKLLFTIYLFIYTQVIIYIFLLFILSS